MVRWLVLSTATPVVVVGADNIGWVVVVVEVVLAVCASDTPVMMPMAAAAVRQILIISTSSMRSTGQCDLAPFAWIHVAVALAWREGRELLTRHAKAGMSGFRVCRVGPIPTTVRLQISGLPDKDRSITEGKGLKPCRQIAFWTCQPIS